MTDENIISHIGTLHKSGRYPWGSGENPAQRHKEFNDIVADLRKKGLTDTQIAENMGMTTTQLRAARSIAKNEQRKEDMSQARRLHEKGLSNMAIGERMGRNESSVRALLDPVIKERTDQLTSTANMLRDQVKDGDFLDIGKGVENHLGVSPTKLNTAVTMLEAEGYKRYFVKVKQLGTGKYTTIKVLAPPDVPYSDVFKNQDKIKQINVSSPDHGMTFHEPRPIQNLSSKRVEVKYGPDGGADKDGVIEVRRGVKDLDLGASRYAQVRIGVDGTHYLKGMAMYADDLPDGVDLRFNTNKASTGNKLDAMKAQKVDKATGKVDEKNPFGAVIKPDGQRGALNIVNEEGDWDKWSKNLSSQMLSKQSTTLAKRQLDLKYKSKQDEYEEIMALTNPTVKKKLLEGFADDADSSAVHLKAAQLPRQATHVILPITNMKENEIYAPKYNDGEKVVLVRYPHGGKFEIPELTVNNRQPDANRLIKQAADAVGIHPKVAERLSGADFDGDTVLVIPNNRREIQTHAPLKELKGFNPTSEYPAYEGMKPISPRTKQQKMGDVSNLITDMTVKGAPMNEISRAVRHSMVVIDAEKHNLNWRKSAKDMGIAELKAKYQGTSRSGASTLISKASSNIKVDDRTARRAKEGGPIDPVTGRKVYIPKGETYVNKAGTTVPKQISSTKMAETTDAHTLVSKPGTVMETIYADHANKLKALANEARKSYLQTPNLEYSASAKAAYDPQVRTLKAKLNVALKNAPLERHAQVVANAIAKAKIDANPEMDAADRKKINGLALEEARIRTGAGKKKVDITPEEWNAIQAGAISNNFLKAILDNADPKLIRQYATPRTSTLMTGTKLSRAKAMLDAGHSQSEVATALGVSTSTLSKSIKEGVS